MRRVSVSSQREPAVAAGMQHHTLPDGCIVQVIADSLDAHVLNGDTPDHLAGLAA